MHAGPGYSCVEVVGQLNGFIDRELTAAEIAQVHEHIRACTHCAEIHAYETSVIGEIKEKLNRIDVPPALLSRVLQELMRAG